MQYGKDRPVGGAASRRALPCGIEGHVRLTILLSWLVASPASAAEVIDALGGEKCGGGARSYSVEFLAQKTLRWRLAVRQ